MKHYDEFMAAGIALDILLKKKESIRDHIDTIADIWKSFEGRLTDEEIIAISSEIKSRIQDEVEEAFYEAGGVGAALMGTGTGKSRIAINIADKKISINPFAKILLVVPTEKLRDEGWKEEFIKWSYMNSWTFIQRTCYASLNRFKDEIWDFVILDEGHNITESNAEFFKQNKVKSCLLLTATRPNKDKIKTLKELFINPFYTLTLDESVKLGIVAPYDITVITTTLDTLNKYIKAGSKKKSFNVTESGQYGYLTARLTAMPDKMGFIDRMRFIYTLRSKTEAAKWILENIIPQDLRTIIFCGSKEQANQLCTHRFYSKPTKPKKPVKTTPYALEKYAQAEIKYRENMLEYRGDTSLTAFMEQMINQIACVDALNEGQNLPMMDVGLVVQLSSNELDFIQRTGRLLRFRPGHTGRILVLCVIDTVDKDWVKKATAGFDQNNIRVISLANLKAGKETITF